jgi:hypothetical protein
MNSKIFALLLVCVCGQKGQGSFGSGQVSDNSTVGGQTVKGQTGGGTGGKGLQQGVQQPGVGGVNQSKQESIFNKTLPGGLEIVEPDPRIMIHKLFFDHTWFHNDYMVATIFKSPLKTVLKKRLLRNPNDLGLVLGSINVIGKQGGDQITQLFAGHLSSEDDLLKSQISKNKDLQQKTQALFAQGDQVAAGLAKIFGVPVDKIKTEFHTHNQHLITLGNLLIAKNFPQYIIELDKFNNHIMLFADLVCDAILHKLFPNGPPGMPGGPGMQGGPGQGKGMPPGMQGGMGGTGMMGPGMQGRPGMGQQ